jgi:Fe2+ or Zn2+ uptake regulation protein
MRTKTHSTLGVLLREASLKATPGRIALLEHFRNSSKPETIKEVHRALEEKLDQVSIYRAVEVFVQKGILRRVDLRHPHAHFEMNLGRAHHHHIACTVCGLVEDVEDCETEGIEYRALQSSKHFKGIERCTEH